MYMSVGSFTRAQVGFQGPHPWRILTFPLPAAISYPWFFSLGWVSWSCLLWDFVCFDLAQSCACCYNFSVHIYNFHAVSRKYCLLLSFTAPSSYNISVPLLQWSLSFGDRKCDIDDHLGLNTLNFDSLHLDQLWVSVICYLLKNEASLIGMNHTNLWSSW